MSTSSAVNAGRPVRLAAVSTPSVPCDPVSGTIIIGPTSSSPVLAGDAPSSSWGVETRSGSPVVNTRPDSEPAIGTRRISATGGAPSPTAISTHKSATVLAREHDRDQIGRGQIGGQLGDQLQRSRVVASARCRDPLRVEHLSGDRRRGLQPLLTRSRVA